ncbi:MAG: flippase [Anaerolineales bacterium]|nr:flippase [Anaerolineales bacterium]
MRAFKDKLRQTWQLVYQNRHSTIGKNIVALYLLEFANYIMPLVTIPYVTRVLGIANYGAVAFVQSLTIYLVMLTEYGFNLSATREIARQRDDPEAINRIAGQVWGAKVVLGLCSLFVLGLAWYLLPRLQEVSLLIVIMSGILLGSILFPTWLFQGLERITTISIINLITRLLAIAAIFILVRGPQDRNLYAASLAVQWIAAGLIAVLLAYYQLGLRPRRPSWQQIRQELTSGWVLFLSRGAAMTYVTANAFILGLLTNDAAVGYYSAAEKVVRAVLRLNSTISQAVYPRFSMRAHQSKERTLLWAGRLLLAMVALGLLTSGALFLSAPLLSRLLVGEDWQPVVSVMRMLAILPLINGITTVFAVQILLPFGHDRPFLNSRLAGGLVNLAVALLLAPIFFQTGMAIAVICAEISVGLVLTTALLRRGLFPLPAAKSPPQ